MDQQEELKRLRELVAKLQNENLRVQNETLTQAVLHARKKYLAGLVKAVPIWRDSWYCLPKSS